jgi:hypothetical protein
MGNPRALQLFNEILAKTKVGRIKWEGTAKELEYFSILPGGFVVSIQADNDWDPQTWCMTLRNGEQELLTVPVNDEGIGAEAMTELYQLARRSALGIDAQVDRLLGELAKL